MKNVSKLIKTQLATGALLALSLSCCTIASAQISGGILGLDQLDESSFRLTRLAPNNDTQNVRLAAEFQFGSDNAHRFVNQLLTPFDGGDGPDYVKPHEFDGGDGPDYVKPHEFDGGDGPDYVKPHEFDGGDGPDYVKPHEFDGGDGPDYVKPHEFDGGDGPDYVKPHEFDGGDGPDYFELVGSDAADSLVGSDAADSLVGSDAADSLIGSDAADSLRFEIEVEAAPALTPLIEEIATEVYELLDAATDQIPLILSGSQAQKLTNQLVATGNEVVIFESAGVSLKSDGNEVAIVSTDHSALPDGAWAEQMSVLIWDLEMGFMTLEQFGAEVSLIVSEIFLTSGIEAQSVRFSVR